MAAPSTYLRSFACAHGGALVRHCPSLAPSREADIQLCAPSRPFSQLWQLFPSGRCKSSACWSQLRHQPTFGMQALNRCSRPEAAVQCRPLRRGRGGANRRTSAPKSMHTTEPTSTPILVSASSSGVMAKASSPMNRLIVKPTPQSSATP